MNGAAANAAAGLAAGFVLCATLAAAVAPAPARAEDAGRSAAPVEVGSTTNFPLPRFASVRASEANVRVGPSERYSVLWTLQARRLPVRIIGEHREWRRIELHTGDRGWMKGNLLTGVDTATPRRSETPLRSAPQMAAPTVALMEPAIPLEINRCDAGWCAVRVAAPERADPALGGLEGWALAEDLWGPVAAPDPTR